MSRKLFITADFTVDLLKPLLSKKFGGDIEIEIAPFGQVYQALSEKAAGEKSKGNMLVFSRIENTLPFFRKVMEFDWIDDRQVEQEAEFFAGQILKAAEKSGSILIFSWFLPPGFRGYGMADYKPGQGARYFVNKANNLLAEKLSAASNIFIIDSERLFANLPVKASNPKFWYAGKVPFTIDFLNLCAEEIHSAITGIEGKSRRLIVVDLDNTMWGGILGDVGWEGLKLGGHDHIGEAYADFQRGLKALNNRGVLLTIASKNYEENALNAIDKHPEMILKKNNFASWRINWQDKAQNIIEIASEVNLGLSSVVFIDDNPAERGRVKEALPEVLVPDWPEDPADYLSALNALTCFDIPAVSEEDKKRAEMFVAERERRNLQKTSISEEDWLRSIGMTVEIDSIDESSKSRVAQLFNKTNQFNLATRRLNENELLGWLDGGNRYMWTFRVSDKFGDSGLTGIITLDIDGKVAEIKDFIMSCRIMGRRVEETMLATALRMAKNQGAMQTVAKFIRTERNQPIYDFLQRSVLKETSPGHYSWDNENDYPLPDCITITEKVTREKAA